MRSGQTLSALPIPSRSASPGGRPGRPPTGPGTRWSFATWPFEFLAAELSKLCSDPPPPAPPDIDAEAPGHARSPGRPPLPSAVTPLPVNGL
jgi:hypothetical protein